MRYLNNILNGTNIPEAWAFQAGAVLQMLLISKVLYSFW